MNKTKMMKLKEKYLERIKLMLGDETDLYLKYLEKPPLPSVRTNTLKISVNELKQRLENKWKIKQLPLFPEAMTIKSELGPGELGKAIEHQLGYYYAQELASMMPPIALEPKGHELVLDLCAAPGSKTTEMAMMMNNQGTIMANDVKIDRLKALSVNLERCGVTNTIITRMNGIVLCQKLAKAGFLFDKILVDASCSGEGTFRSDPDAAEMWNFNMIKKYASMQKKLVSDSLSCLKPNGIMVYSTCTHAPEENEEIVQFAVDKFNVKIEPLRLPLKTRNGLSEWQGHKFSQEIKNCARIWPQDNDTEGFFIARMRK